MEQDLFALLPSEIITDILKRLPVRTVAFSKCVCKQWLDLLESDDFVNSYHSKSAALAVLMPERNSNWCKIFEIDDELDDLQSRNPITMFDFPRRVTRIGGSANGLLFLHSFDVNFDANYVCNPITRQFIECHFHEELYHQHGWRQSVAYGFGVSKVTGDHKVIRINSKSDHCHVYTLGTGQWRRVEAAGAASSDFGGFCWFGAFVNGHLYWTVSVINQRLIACFDLETECFSTFAGPPVRWYRSNVDLFTLRDCLCFWDESDDDENRIWLMKECGAQKSWRKEYVIKQHPDCGIDGFEWFQTIKVFKNGDILVLCDEKKFFCYSIKTETYQEIPSFGAVREYDSYISSLLLTPSFRSLKCFGMEDVISF